MKKLVFSILFFFIFSSICHAQHYGFNFYGGLNGGYLGFKDFNTFRASYNKVNNIELKPFGFSKGYNYCAEVVMIGIVMNYSFEKITTRAIAEYEFGDKRVFQLDSRNYGCEFGYAIGDEDKPKIIPYFGIFIANSVLNSFYLTRDGYEDYGNSKTLNGSYQTLAFSVPLGVKLYLPIAKPFFLMLGAEVNPIFTSLTYENWMDGAPLQEIPIDYEAYQKGASYDYKGEYLKPRMTAYNLKLGIGVHIGD